MSSLPKFTIRDLLEAGVHYGHRTMRWNPKMAPFLYGVKDNSHIIDLQQTAPLLHMALKEIFEVARKNGKILFVGTKQQASSIVKEAAERSGQYFVNHRWLGGMITNWGTVSASIKTLVALEEKIKAAEEGTTAKYTKKEILDMQRKREKLELSLGGIREMNGKPDLIFVIDTNKESIAIKEANILGIPVVGILDSNSDPHGVSHPIPGNDDASRSIRLYCKLVSDTILSGIQKSMLDSGVEISDLQDLESVKEMAVRAKEEKSAARASKSKKVLDKKKAAPKSSQSDKKSQDKSEKNTEEATAEKKVEEKKAPAKKPAAKKASTEKKAEPAKKDAADKKAKKPATKAAAKKDAKKSTDE